MALKSTYVNTRQAGYLLGFLFSIFSASTLLQLASGQAQQPQTLCSGNVCVAATIYSNDPKTIEFSLLSSTQVGWLGLGVGGDPNSMAGNDLAICWPKNAGDPGAVISQRSAIRNGRPQVTSPTVAFKVQDQKSGLSASSNEFVCTFSRPLNLVTSSISETASSINVIFAVGLEKVVPDAGGDPQKASFSKHSITGKGALTIVRKQGSSGSDTNPIILPTGGNGGGSGPGDSMDQTLAKQEEYNTLLRVHGVMMALAFLLILPLGAFLARFFGHMYHIFRWHRPLQVLGFLTAIIAFICIVVGFTKSPSPKTHFTSSRHAMFGLIIICALVLQVCIGVFIFHTFDPNRDPKKIHIPTWMHRFMGYAALICGLVQVHFGMDAYGAWPGGKETIWIVYYVWVAVLGTVFLGGSAVKLLTHRKDNKSGQGNGYNIRSDLKHEYHEDHLELQQRRSRRSDSL